MVDIHTHVLPLVDDGSASLEDSIKILQDAKKCGVTKIIATPHFRDSAKASLQQINNSYNLIKPHAEEMGIELYLGQEIKFYGSDLKHLVAKEHLTLNGTKLVLLEFDFFRDDDISEVAYSYSKKGFIPVIAHLERYPYCLDISVVEDIKSCGGLIQINASSVVGKLGKKIKKFVFNLIKYELVDFISSDVHSFRENDMQKAYLLIEKKFGQEVAQNLFKNNANYYIFSGKFNLQ